MALNYPSTLPNPEVSLHTPRNRVCGTDLPGFDVYALQEYDYQGAIDVEFFFTAEQSAIFWAFWKTSLMYGGRWFNCSWPALRAGGMVVQFVTQPKLVHVYNGAFRFSASVQVRGATRAVDSCESDPYYTAVTLPNGFSAHTVLSLRGETLGDSSSNPKTLTGFGGIATSTAQAKYRTSSIFFNGSTQYLKSALDAEFYQPNGYFSVEAEVFPTVITPQNRYVFSVSENLTGGFAYWYLAIHGDGKLAAYCQPTTGGGGGFMSSATGLIDLNAWHNVRLECQNHSAVLFLNGAIVAGPIAWPVFPSGKILNVGVGAVPNGYTDATVGRFAGYMQDLRFTSNVNRRFEPYPRPGQTYCDHA
jgi:hypothetical protein